MSTIIERDIAMQEVFGQYLSDFEDDMRAKAKKIKEHVDDARDNMQDSSGQKALDILDEFADEILNNLPGIAEFGTMQKKKAKSLREAKNIRFTR